MSQQDAAQRPLDRNDPRTLGGFRLLTVLPGPSVREAADTDPVSAGGSPYGVTGYGSAGAWTDGAVESGLRDYLARSTRDARTVVIRAVRPGRSGDPALRERLRRETAAAEACAGSWVLPLIDADPDSAVPWIAYGCVAALPLPAYLTEYGALPEASVRALGTSLAEVLRTLHDAGWAHAGLSTDAVSIAADGVRLGALDQVTPVSEATPGAEVRSLARVLAFAATGTRQVSGSRLASWEPMAPALREILTPALGTDSGPVPRLSQLHSALRAPLSPGLTETSGSPLRLPGAAVAELTARANALLALESRDGVPVGPDRATRPMGTPPVAVGTPEGVEPHPSNAAPSPAGPDGTLQLRRPQGDSAVVPHQPGHPDHTLALGAGVPDQPDAPGGPERSAPDAREPDAREPDAHEAALNETSAGDDSPGDGPERARSTGSPEEPTGGQEPYRRSRSRRSLFVAGAAGLGGLLVGGGAVAGWVTGRGGGLDALTRPREGSGAAGAASDRKPPRGTPPAARWRFDLGGEASSKGDPLVWRDEVAVFMGLNGSAGVDLRSGKTLWSRDDLTSITLPVRIDARAGEGGSLGLVLDRSRLVAFDPRTGKRRWSDDRYHKDPASAVGHSADDVRGVSSGGRLVFLQGKKLDSTDGPIKHVLAAFDVRARRELWDVLYDGGTSVLKDPVIHHVGKTVVALGNESEGPTVTGFEQHTGDRAWRWKPKGLDGLDKLSLDAGSHQVFASREGELLSMDLESGRQRWSAKLVSDPDASLSEVFARPSPPARKGGAKRRETWLYLTQGGMQAFALSAEDGREKWRTRLGDDSLFQGEPQLATSDSGKTLMVASSSGVTAINARNGEPLWRFGEIAKNMSDTYGVYPAGESVIVTHGATAFAFPVD